jgi:hypothetical protein
MKTAVSIGTRVEMFVDDWLIERMSALRLKLHAPERKEIAFVPDRPWEGPTSGYFSVIQDEDRIRLYYRGHCPGEDSDADQMTCYAESEDGLRFVRPELGQYPFRGMIAPTLFCAAWRRITSPHFSTGRPKPTRSGGTRRSEAWAPAKPG